MIFRSWVSHQDFRTVIELQCSTSRKKQGHCHLPLVVIFVKTCVNTAHVVIIRENHNVVEIAVHVIIGQAFVNLSHTAAPSSFAHQTVHYSTLQWEVHHTR